MLKKNKYFFPISILLLAIVMLAAIGFGAVSIRPEEMLSSLKHFFQGKPSYYYAPLQEPFWL